ncbi:MAG: hypothetical protein KA352_09525 [Flavobacteriales bacterium]|nr:hypothetical protein [Flavobacteriales bacterium]
MGVLLLKGIRVIAGKTEVVNTPGVWDMPANLKKAMERMAEHLNTSVVQFLLKRKDGSTIKVALPVDAWN